MSPATRSCSTRALPLLTEALRAAPSTLDAIVSLQLGLLAAHPDTLIARKVGAEAATAVTRRRARCATAAARWPTSTHRCAAPDTG